MGRECKTTEHWSAHRIILSNDWDFRGGGCSGYKVHPNSLQRVPLYINVWFVTNRTSWLQVLWKELYFQAEGRRKRARAEYSNLYRDWRVLSLSRLLFFLSTASSTYTRQSVKRSSTMQSGVAEWRHTRQRHRGLPTAALQSITDCGATLSSFLINSESVSCREAGADSE